MSTPRCRVAVIGAGPRGLAVAVQLAGRPGAEVHLIDPLPGGAVWDPAQDPELLMNSRTRQATVFADDTVDAAAGGEPGVHGPSFHEWHVAAGGELGPDDFATRAHFGEYLRWVVNQLRDQGVHIHPHRVTALAELPDGTQALTLSNHRIVYADSAVLALGHLPAAPDDDGTMLSAYAKSHGLQHVGPGPATAAALRGVSAGEPVAVLGAGLNFYDVLALLTEGRGGRYQRDGDGRLRYVASGDEPVLLMGSGRGVPYLARANRPGPVTLEIVTDEVVERWSAADGTLSFAEDVWPLMIAEMSRTWTVAGGTGEFDLDALLDPFAGGADGAAGPRDVATLTARLRDLLTADLDSALATPRGPVTAMGETLAVLKDRVRTVVAAGGISRESVLTDLQGWFRSAGAFLAAGPPALRVEQALALVDAGLLKALGAGIRVSTADGRFLISGRDLATPVTVRALVEARLPADDAERTADPFVRALVDDGYATLADGGLVASRARTGEDTACRLRDAQGEFSARRFVIGLPVQPQEWNIANLPQPGRADRTLQQARSIADQIVPRRSS
ncbi:FAD/NAD(P)-binding protein [Actinoplanes sp. NBRC 101535]|uniref:FAD/NAD(P)-binding protein n=1 Tax=Actinoplanes sp. NBRC 101535 TaxID=3032196 RepID=UPI0024A58FF5|nr:FAD/NAD(P)-binding protein [Actinoplanes sp. NBRC 101535]GLY03795.1 hypothetical protein Acsp01_41740 [Actinoplanes sp. NBRC 101535]